MVSRNLIHRAVRRDRIRSGFQDVFLRFRMRIVIVGFEEEPLLLLIARPRLRANEMPTAVKLFAVEFEGKVALGIALCRIALRPPESAVPDHDGAPAIFPFRNDPFEIAIIDGVIFDMDGKALDLRIEARPFRDSPAFVNAVEFETEVVMKPARSVFLNDEAKIGAGFLNGRRLAQASWRNPACPGSG